MMHITLLSLLGDTVIVIFKFVTDINGRYEYECYILKLSQLVYLVLKVNGGKLSNIQVQECFFKFSDKFMVENWTLLNPL